MKPVRVKNAPYTSKDVLNHLLKRKVKQRQMVKTSVNFITNVMGQSHAWAVLALGLVRAKKYAVDWDPDLHPQGQDGRFTETGGSHPKGSSIADTQAMVEREALAYIKEEFLSKGRSFADPEEYKEMKANIWDWKHVWQEPVQNRVGMTFTGSGDTFMPGKQLEARLTQDDLKTVMTKHDIDYHSVKVVDNLGEFTVSGKTFNMDGEYDPQTKEVRISSSLNKTDLPGILKHEVQHAKLDSVIGKFGTAIDSMKTELSRGGRVTPYASDWWDAVSKGTATYKDAVDETLAEIATLSAKQYAQVDHNWQNLYTQVNEEYRKGR